MASRTEFESDIGLGMWEPWEKKLQSRQEFETDLLRAARAQNRSAASGDFGQTSAIGQEREQVRNASIFGMSEPMVQPKLVEKWIHHDWNSPKADRCWADVQQEKRLKALAAVRLKMLQADAERDVVQQMLHTDVAQDVLLKNSHNIAQAEHQHTVSTQTSATVETPPPQVDPATTAHPQPQYVFHPHTKPVESVQTQPQYVPRHHAEPASVAQPQAERVLYASTTPASAQAQPHYSAPRYVNPASIEHIYRPHAEPANTAQPQPRLVFHPHTEPAYVQPQHTPPLHADPATTAHAHLQYVPQSHTGFQNVAAFSSYMANPSPAQSSQKLNIQDAAQQKQFANLKTKYEVGCKAVLQKVYASHLAEEALLLAATTQDARAMAQAETQLAECKAAEAQAQDILEQLENRMDAAQLGYDSTANRMNPSVSMLADFGQATRNHETERNEAQREALREIEERLHYVDARWQVEQRYGVALLESQREVAHLQGKNVNLEREFSGWREQAAQITSCINKLIPQEEPKKETEDTEPQKSVPKKKTDDPAFKHYKAAVQEAFARGHPHISKKQLEQLMRQAFQEAH